MNSLEKKSFYSFLALYIFSSLLFISLIAYWYYEAQKNALENEIYYKLQHIADLKSGEIIMAHMKKIELPKFSIPDDVEMALIDTNGSVIEGKLIEGSPIKNNDNEIGKVLINNQYPFAIVKYLSDYFDPKIEYKSEEAVLKIIKPDWIK